MRDIRVSSWLQLNACLSDLSWNQALGRWRSPYVFRGVCDAALPLTTSLGRLGGAYHALEAHILRSFRKYAPRQAPPDDSTWYWLALAQHHGLPTRLLDWTYSPFVALHFVTETLERYHCDGVVWCVDHARVHETLPAALRDVLAAEQAAAFTGEMLLRVAPTLAELDSLAAEPFVVFFEPPSLDERIVNQFALFSLMSEPRALLDEWLAQHEDVWRRIIIPARLKWEIRDRLDEANITERVLFPGLDGLSRWLRRYYLPRDAPAGGAACDHPGGHPRLPDHQTSD